MSMRTCGTVIQYLSAGRMGEEGRGLELPSLDSSLSLETDEEREREGQTVKCQPSEALSQ